MLKAKKVFMLGIAAILGAALLPFVAVFVGVMLLVVAFVMIAEAL
jgi:hypothetical protein